MTRRNKHAMIAARVWFGLLLALVADMTFSAAASLPAMPFFYIWIGLLISVAVSFVVAAIFAVRAMLEP